jgi:two-component system, sensor histidine kinase PdtaS
MMCIKNFITFCIVFVSVVVVAQSPNQQKIDSLLILAKQSKQVNVKIELLNQMFEWQAFTDYSKLQSYNSQIKQLIQTNNYPKGWAHFYLNQAIIDGFNANFVAAESYSKKAAIIYKQNNDLKNNLNAQFLIAFNAWSLNKNEFAKSTAIQALKLAYKNKFWAQVTKINYFLGCFYNKDNDFKTALFFLNKAIQINKKDYSENLFLKCMNELSVIYIKTNQFKKAKEFSDQGVAIANQHNYQTKINCALYVNNASINYDLGNNDEAQKSSIKAIELARYINEKNYLFHCLNMNASILFAKKKYQESINYAKAALTINKDTKNSLYAYRTIGNAYFELKQFNASKQYHLKIINNLNADFVYDYYPVYDEISKTEFELKNYKQAYLYKEEYKQLASKYDSINNDNAVKEIQTKFEVEEKELKYKLLVAEKQKTENTLHEHKKTMQFQYFLIIFLIFLALFGFIIYRTITKKNKQLILKNIEIADKKEILEKTQIKLNQSLYTKEVLLKEIHHRVKNNLQLIMSLLNIQAQQQNFTTIDDFMEKSQMRINSLSLIHENLSLNGETDKVNFQQYVISLVNNLNSSFLQPHNPIHFDINTHNIVLCIETAIPLGIIINELTTNAIKHAFAETKNKAVTIELREEAGNFEFIFCDNGQLQPKKTTNKKSVGLLLVQVLVAQLKGTIQIDTKAGYEYRIHFAQK